MKRRTKETISEWGALLAWIALMLVILSALLLSGGCTRKVYVPVENTVLRTDTVYRSQLRVDSVKLIEHVYETDTRYDSIVPILDSLNNVIGWDRYHFRETTKMNNREIARLQSLVDSLRAVRQDTVIKQVPYPVERELTKWEQTKQDVGGMAIGALAIAIVVAVTAWIVKHKQRRKS